MKTETILKNWAIGSTPEILGDIHENHINITIYDRDLTRFKNEINSLLKKDIKFESSGDIDTILNELTSVIERDQHSTIVNDIQNLLHLFKEISNTKRFRLLLATIKTNMCTKFHTDINNLRMLCTYSGPGTLWLTEDNINRKALDAYEDNESIIIDKNSIEQTKTGSVVILKGAKYPKNATKAAVHRSPTIEESDEIRLLLRIDLN